MPDPVRIESDVWERWNFDALAHELGCNKFEAVGRIAFVWGVASKQRTTTLPEAAIRVYLGVTGVEAIIASELGERVDGGIRLKGSHRFDAWWTKQDQHRVAAAAGGAARVTSRGADGKFVMGPTNHQPETSRQPADDQRETSSPPGDDQVKPASLISDLRSHSDPQSSQTRIEARARARTKRPEVAIPADWSPTDQHRALAAELAVDLAGEAAHFRDHHEARATRFADWHAAFRTWLRNARKFHGGARQQQLQPRGVGRANPLPASEYAPAGRDEGF